MCSEYKFLIRCMIFKYFLTFCILSFHILDEVLSSTKVFSFDDLIYWLFFYYMWFVCVLFTFSPCKAGSVPSTFHSAGSFRCLNARATFSSRESTSAEGAPDRLRKRVKFRACWLPALVARNWAAS